MNRQKIFSVVFAVLLCGALAVVGVNAAPTYDGAASLDLSLEQNAPIGGCVKESKGACAAEGSACGNGGDGVCTTVNGNCHCVKLPKIH